MRQWTIRLLILAGLAAVAFLAYEKFGTRPPPPVAEPAPVKVSYVQVTPKDLPVVLDFVARTESSQAVTINARVEGFLDSREYTEGQLVHTGDVLFQIDPKPFQADLDEAIAALTGQQTALRVAQQSLARVKPLAELNALSKKDLDDATGAVDRANAAVDQATAAVEKSRLTLSYTTITSPVTGVADRALQQNGSYIGLANSQLTTVSLVTPMWVNFSVSENQLTAWNTQMRAGTLRAPADGKFTFTLLLPDGEPFAHGGVVTFESPSYDASTGTFLVRGTFENPDGTMKPNQYVTARVAGYIRPQAILVPQRAVHQAQTGHFVWVIDAEGKSELRPVEVGEWQGDDWIISTGVKAGEKVVVDGLVARQGMALAPEPLAETPADKDAGQGQGN